MRQPTGMTAPALSSPTVLAPGTFTVSLFAAEPSSLARPNAPLSSSDFYGILGVQKSATQKVPPVPTSFSCCRGSHSTQQFHSIGILAAQAPTCVAPLPPASFKTHPSPPSSVRLLVPSVAPCTRSHSYTISPSLPPSDLSRSLASRAGDQEGLPQAGGQVPP